VCGAVSGGVLAIGLLYGGDRFEESILGVYAKSGEFMRRFAEVNDAVRCIDIIGLDVSGEKGVREYYARNLKEETCSGVVSSSVQILLDLLEDWED
jgi:C_GCAxxG_C_C family probable redox protein